MNTFVLLTVMALAGCVASETYTDRYDDINIEEILDNRKLLVAYIKCVLDQGRCAAEGKELKNHIQDALQNGCEKCTYKQKIAVRKIVKHLKEKETDYYKQLLAKYDPDEKYKPTYEAFLAGQD